jgi:hypothetical protein
VTDQICKNCKHYHEGENGGTIFKECWFWPPTATPLFQNVPVKPSVLKQGQQMQVQTVLSGVWGSRPPVNEDTTCGQWGPKTSDVN